AKRIVRCGHSACFEAVAMAVSELAENMLKYSDDPGPFVGSISIITMGGVVRISATNPVATADQARGVAGMVAAIRATGDVAALSRARLADLLATPGLPRAQLGLVRIAYEGGFELSAVCAGRLVQVNAERPCAPQ